MSMCLKRVCVFCACMIRDPHTFKRQSEVIVPKRSTADLSNVKSTVYAYDIFEIGQ